MDSGGKKKKKGPQLRFALSRAPDEVYLATNRVRIRFSHGGHYRLPPACVHRIYASRCPFRTARNRSASQITAARSSFDDVRGDRGAPSARIDSLIVINSLRGRSRACACRDRNKRRERPVSGRFASILLHVASFPRNLWKSSRALTNEITNKAG